MANRFPGTTSLREISRNHPTDEPRSEKRPIRRKLDHSTPILAEKHNLRAFAPVRLVHRFAWLRSAVCRSTGQNHHPGDGIQARLLVCSTGQYCRFRPADCFLRHLYEPIGQKVASGEEGRTWRGFRHLRMAQNNATRAQLR